MYIGRFAPSPTGHLHLGSLVAALGSYLRAKSMGGLWLLRIEDLDPPREMPGATENIRCSLHAHGLFEDGGVLYQSSRLEAYQEQLNRLIASTEAYPCQCSRKQIANIAVAGEFGHIYPETCRKNMSEEGRPSAWRVKTYQSAIEFSDTRCGRFSINLRSELGDFIVKRSDGLFAYQLAVVVDDAMQGVTEVVRGEDLLDNTSRQIHLQRLLGYPQPEYLHLPLVCHSDGQKLSKQTFAAPLDNTKAATNLGQALCYLGLIPPSDMQHAPVSELLDWAVASFSTSALPPFERGHSG